MLIVRLRAGHNRHRVRRPCGTAPWLRNAQRGEDAPHFVVGRPEMVQYASEYFVRQMHCNREEAKKFTAQLTADVRTIMAGRSVLPPPHSETCDASSADLLPHLTHQPYTST